jgi:hypothetical protein
LLLLRSGPKTVVANRTVDCRRYLDVLHRDPGEIGHRHLRVGFATRTLARDHISQLNDVILLDIARLNSSVDLAALEALGDVVGDDGIRLP